MSERNLADHTRVSTKRREPPILNHVKMYNNLCKEIHKLIAQKKAPAGAIAPLSINSEGVFKLDVDDEIWQDIGLDVTWDNIAYCFHTLSNFLDTRQEYEYTTHGIGGSNDVTNESSK